MDRSRRRRFGQNFLDDATAKMIAEDLPVKNHEEILEIGPGHGAMTKHLLKLGAALTAVEIDEECVAVLQNIFHNEPHFSVVHSDFMKFDLNAWLIRHPAAWITGNLPYNVSTAIAARLMPELFRTRGFMGMVQLEVAERLCAVPGTHAYGSLSVWVRAYGEPKILRKIGPEHFTPKPNVDSATVLILPREKPLKAPPAFFEWVQLAFAMKRKRLANALSKTFDKKDVFEALAGLNLSENTRAEELSPEQFLTLYQRLVTEKIM
ncbi:MAG: 16S rRNA (adenine(1518)-N(6)/adenine(1519)-N(6))-dimethyltransferase RsmA [Fibrobacter sp.]|jgi:16S rRNA (adenine1518-N6/adenine1519-N6)-dimethyltransferase|nr:16S rRNA (adenine(1518)-N(6)/adenine(1519)-N(6))-dimethyltransferase RsmA [Fibrobacter sp.]